jgi:hypothetical protein
LPNPLLLRTLGDPREEATQFGPLARFDLRDELHRRVVESITGGAVAVTGCNPEGGSGVYYQPSILDRVQPGICRSRTQKSMFMQGSRSGIIWAKFCHSLNRLLKAAGNDC